MDVECVRVTAVKSLFDLIHVYGLGAFEDAADDKDHTNGNDNNGDDTNSSRDLLETTAEGQASSLEGDSNKGEHSESGWSKTASNLIAILSSTLDSEVSDGDSYRVGCTTEWRVVMLVTAIMSAAPQSGDSDVGDKYHVGCPTEWRVVMLVTAIMLAVLKSGE